MSPEEAELIGSLITPEQWRDIVECVKRLCRFYDELIEGMCGDAENYANDKAAR